jgi:hypothetical protein
MTKAKKSNAEIAAILAKLESRHVVSDRDAILRDGIDALLCRDDDDNPLPKPRLFTRGLEIHGLAVCDASGGGKTHIIHSTLTKHPALGAGVDGPARFLHVTTPSPATLKSLGCEVLRVSGYPEISERRERWSIWNVVRNRLTALGIVVLWVDEAHDLISTKNEVEDLLKTLKRLMQGDQGFIVILSGTDLLMDLIHSDPEVDRRFDKIQFPQVMDATEGDELRAVIARYCEIAGLKPPSEPDLVPRLIHACRGRFGICIEKSIGAIERALKEGAPGLGLINYSEAWMATETRPYDQNPFASPHWASIDLGPRKTPQFGRRRK